MSMIAMPDRLAGHPVLLVRLAVFVNNLGQSARLRDLTLFCDNLQLSYCDSQIVRPSTPAQPDVNFLAPRDA